MEEKRNIFEETYEVSWLPGVKIRRMLRYDEVRTAAKMYAALLHGMVDELGVSVRAMPDCVAEMYVFCSCATDMDTSKYVGAGGDVEIERLVDELTERYATDKEDEYSRWNGILSDLIEKCENWYEAVRMGDMYLYNLKDMYEREHSLEYKLLAAFGPALEGGHAEMMANASGLTEALIGLMKKANANKGGRPDVINFAKKKK